VRPDVRRVRDAPWSAYPARALYGNGSAGNVPVGMSRRRRR
jgi:hypothetical protein